MQDKTCFPAAEYLISDSKNSTDPQNSRVKEELRNSTQVKLSSQMWEQMSGLWSEKPHNEEKDHKWKTCLCYKTSPQCCNEIKCYEKYSPKINPVPLCIQLKLNLFTSLLSDGPCTLVLIHICHSSGNNCFWVPLCQIA